MSNSKKRLAPEQLSVQSFPTLVDPQEPAEPAFGMAANFSSPNGCELTRTGCSFMYCD